MAQVDYIVKLNHDIDVFVEEYRDCAVTRLYNEFDVNESAKNRLNALIRRMITYSNSLYLKQIENKDDFCIVSWNAVTHNLIYSSVILI